MPDGAIPETKSNVASHRQAARAAVEAKANQATPAPEIGATPSAQAVVAAPLVGGGQSDVGAQQVGAPSGTETPVAIVGSKAIQTAQQAGEASAQRNSDSHSPGDARFANPHIAAIVEVWRARQDMVRAQQRLTLQAKAICRRYAAGDKDEADKLYTAITKGQEHPQAESAGMAIFGLLRAREPLEEQRAAYEKQLEKMAKALPVAAFCDDVKGFGYMALAKVIGECGDLTAYEKGIAGVWKRAGLAVIEGQRQRRVAGEAALLHGYSPERRSVFWNIAAALLKAQGKDDAAGPYRRFYDAEKARQMEAGLTKGHAHNRALRHMTKQLLEDLLAFWNAQEAQDNA